MRISQLPIYLTRLSYIHLDKESARFCRIHESDRPSLNFAMAHLEVCLFVFVIFFSMSLKKNVFTLLEYILVKIIHMNQKIN